MLSLAPPRLAVEGVSLYPDDREPHRWYYVRQSPRARRVSLQLFRRSTDAAPRGGAFFDLEVDLGIDDRERAAIKAELARVLSIRAETIDLVPAPFFAGTAELMLAGGERMHGPLQPVTPALTGHSTAFFSLMLDEEGATLVENALRQEAAAAGVWYSMQLEGIQPAFDAVLTVSSKRALYRSLRQLHVSVLWISFDSTELVERLEQEGVVTLTVTEHVTGEDRTRAIDAMRERVAQLAASFLQPAAPPPPIDDPPRGAFASFSVREIEEAFIEDRQLVFSMRERHAVRTYVFPNGHLSDLARRVTPEITRIEASDDPFFSERRLFVDVLADLEEESIARITVTAEMEGDRRSATITAAGKNEIDFRWPMPLDGTRRTVTARYDVEFAHDGEAQWPPLSSKPVAIDGQTFVVAPRELYFANDVRFETVSDFPWMLFPSLEVETREPRATRTLDAKHPFATWRWFRLDADAELSYRVSMRRVDGAVTMLPAAGWLTSRDAYVPIPDPLPERRTVAISWRREGLRLAVVTVTYRSGALPVQRDTFRFDDTHTEPRRFVVRVLDATQPVRVAYEAKLVRDDGTRVDIPMSSTAQSAIVLSATMHPRRAIAVSIAPPADGASIEATLTHEESGASKTFTADGFLEIAYARSPDVVCTIRRRDAGGVTETIRTLRGGEDDLAVAHTKAPEEEAVR